MLRAMLAAAILALPTVGNCQSAAPVNSNPAAVTGNIDPSPQVFLRRLHLVRPDLIPYPISVEIFC